MLNNKSILITGGTGSFGTKFVEVVLKKYPKIKKLIVFSRDELKQSEMAKKFDPKKNQCLRYFIGDVRDEARLVSASEGIDIIIHAAALKQVPTTEYNPFECIQTNILGSQNVITAAIKNNIKKVIALSTDKACSPINLYGATKLCSEKLFTAAQNFIGNKKITFSVARYGNVMNSRGSVVPIFLSQKKKNILSVTDKRMTRFNISLESAVDMILWIISSAKGGEIFIPNLPSYKVIDLAQSIAPKAKIEFIGIRPGEKIHEELITKSESVNTINLGKYFAILPTSMDSKITNFYKKFKRISLNDNFQYSSGSNKNILNLKELKKIISKI